MKYSITIDSVSEMAKCFHINVFEKENASGKGIVIAIGSGLLMATMDALKTCKIGIEFGKPERNNPYFPDFLALAVEWADYICIHAWFSITKPAQLANLMAYMPGEKIFWKSNENLFIGKRFDTFSDMSNFLNNPSNYKHDNLVIQVKTVKLTGQCNDYE